MSCQINGALYYFIVGSFCQLLKNYISGASLVIANVKSAVLSKYANLTIVHFLIQKDGYSMENELNLISCVFSFMDKSGNLDRKFQINDKIIVKGTPYIIRQYEIYPKYLDGGATPFQVRLTCIPA